jgi:hypothetical protein
VTDCNDFGIRYVYTTGRFPCRSLRLPLLQRAFEETFGCDAGQVRLRDLSGFEDAALSPLMEQLHDELFNLNSEIEQVVLVLLLVLVLEKSRYLSVTLMQRMVREDSGLVSTHNPNRSSTSTTTSTSTIFNFGIWVQGGHGRLAVARD